MLLALLRTATRAILWLFFRKVELHGRDLIPRTGPLLVVANHPNVVLDILVVGSAIPRDDLRFLGKSTLFRSPLLGVMLRLAGVIPVSRTQDAGEPMSANREMLRRAVSVLEENATLVVFPEGLSHAEMKVRPLRPGMARIALAAAESGSDVAIVPMGLDFTDPGTFRSDVAIHVGSPVSVVTFLASHQADRRLAEQELTALLHERLAALTRHIDDARLETLVRSLSEIYADHVAQEFEDAGELSRRLRAEQEIIRAAHYFAGREPGLIQEMSAQLRAHLRKLRLLHVHPSSIAPGRWSRQIPGRIAAVVLAPLALVGWAANAVPYYLPRAFVPRYQREPEMIATVKLAAGAIIFPTYYLLLWGAASLWAGPGAALLGVFAVVGLGLFTILYHERLLVRWPLWHVTAKPRWRRHLLRRLARERAEIVRQLDRLKEQYIGATST